MSACQVVKPGSSCKQGTSITHRQQV